MVSLRVGIKRFGLESNRAWQAGSGWRAGGSLGATVPPGSAPGSGRRGRCGV